MAWPMNSTPTANLHLRSSGSTSGDILDTIPKGTQISVTGDAVNGWYPVSYGGKTGWVKGTYLNPMTTPTGTGTGTGSGTGAGTGTTPAPNALNQSNPFYDPTDKYGATSSQYDTPLVKGAATFDQEYEKWLTEQGFGGMNQKGNFARNLADRAKAGLATAQMTNPNLIPRDYLTKTLGGSFLANARAAATPVQRGEFWQGFAPSARWTSR